jgi:AraC-like DNA-binding protein
MPQLSTALIIFILLAFMAVRLVLATRDNSSVWPFAILVSAAALQALLISLRWDFALLYVRPLQVILSCLLPAMAWLSFRSFTRSETKRFDLLDLLHAAPAMLCAAALFVLPDAIDFIIFATFIGYGIACLWLALRGENVLDRASLAGVVDVQRALWLVTFSLFASALVDLIVFLDFFRASGSHAPMLIGWGNIVWLVAIGLSAILTSTNITESEDEEAPAANNENESKEDARIIDVATHQLTVGGLAKDPNLTLTRLARRCAMPVRQISRAVNRLQKRNVSQFVNDIRVREACRLLRESQLSITQVIYESGFQTKSNFNREFLRFTGKTPSQWRADGNGHAN